MSVYYKPAWSWRKHIRGSLECMHASRLDMGEGHDIEREGNERPSTHPSNVSVEHTCTYLLHGRVVPSSVGLHLCCLHGLDIQLLGMVLSVVGRREQGRPKEGRQEEGACRSA